MDLMVRIDPMCVKKKKNFMISCVNNVKGGCKSVRESRPLMKSIEHPFGLNQPSTFSIGRNQFEIFCSDESGMDRMDFVAEGVFRCGPVVRIYMQRSQHRSCVECGWNMKS